MVDVDELRELCVACLIFNFVSHPDLPCVIHCVRRVVFHWQVYIFNILYDPKFEHFQPVMDAYISGHFSAVLVYKWVFYESNISSWNRLLII